MTENWIFSTGTSTDMVRNAILWLTGRRSRGLRLMPTMGQPLSTYPQPSPIGFASAFHALLKTKIRLSSSAYPQSDRRSEVTNKLVGQSCEDAPQDWASSLTLAEFASNSASHTATGLAPIKIMYGSLPLIWRSSVWSSSSVRICGKSASCPRSSTPAPHLAVQLILLPPFAQVKRYVGSHRDMVVQLRGEAT